MRSGSNDFNYFKLTKLANFAQFKQMLLFGLEDWGPGPPGAPLATPLSHDQDIYYESRSYRVSRPQWRTYRWSKMAQYALTSSHVN